MFNIRFPVKPVVISDKDSNHPDFDPAHHLARNVMQVEQP